MDEGSITGRRNGIARAGFKEILESDTYPPI